MLEQLAAIGAERGVRRFDAAVLSTNRLMLSVFRNAGFAVNRAVLEELNVSVDITPVEAVVQRIDERDHFAALASLRPILAPSSVAVVGAADTPGNVGRALVENIRNGGFGGVVEWVDPAGTVVSAGRSLRSLGELEVAPDLVILAVEGAAVLDFAAAAAARGAKALLVVPAGPEQDIEASSRVERQAAGHRAGCWAAAGRPQLAGADQQRARGSPERDVHGRLRELGGAGDLLTLRRGGDRTSFSCGGPRPRRLAVRLAR